MLSKVDNPLAIIKLENLIEKYGTPLCNIDRLAGDLYAIEANSKPLIPEKATIMPQELPQVSVTIETCPPDPSQTGGPVELVPAGCCSSFNT